MVPDWAIAWDRSGDSVWLAKARSGISAQPWKRAGLYRASIKGRKPVEHVVQIDDIRQIKVSPDGNYVLMFAGGGGGPCVVVPGDLKLLDIRTNQVRHVGKDYRMGGAPWRSDSQAVLFYDAEENRCAVEFDLEKSTTMALPTLEESQYLGHAFYHPTKNSVWTHDDSSIYELVACKWVRRYPPPEQIVPNQ